MGLAQVKIPGNGAEIRVQFHSFNGQRTVGFGRKVSFAAGLVLFPVCLGVFAHASPTESLR